MAGPAAALIPVTPAVKEAVKALTGDLVTFRGQVFRKVTYEVDKEEQEFLTPVDYELHVNPISVGLGLAGAAAAVVLGLIAWHGLTVPTLTGPVTIFPGLKSTEAGQRLGEKFLPPPTPKGESCGELHDRWRRLRADPFWFLNPFVVGELRAIESDADLLECAWRANP